MGEKGTAQWCCKTGTEKQIKLKKIFWKHYSSKNKKLTKIRLERPGLVDLSKDVSVKQTKLNFCVYKYLFIHKLVNQFDFCY